MCHSQEEMTEPSPGIALYEGQDRQSDLGLAPTSQGQHVELSGKLKQVEALEDGGDKWGHDAQLACEANARADEVKPPADRVRVFS
jgi:hypothetical protein